MPDSQYRNDSDPNAPFSSGNGFPQGIPSEQPPMQPIPTQEKQQPSQVPHDTWYVLGSIVDHMSDISPADMMDPGPARDEKLREMGKMLPWIMAIVTPFIILFIIIGYLSYASSH